ncbi:hypothetical protein QR98_0027540 [Sarcoptes scabiei]|uniref:Uncharacterized protein n=1 Tax=Sarcoptes scabiei TaxID=52283 RepID=A0A132A093_SARSC|nr:hypothetical protein QR98_0027540 [Sarcoptes scabiei]
MQSFLRPLAIVFVKEPSGIVLISLLIALVDDDDGGDVDWNDDEDEEDLEVLSYSSLAADFIFWTNKHEAFGLEMVFLMIILAKSVPILCT